LTALLRPAPGEYTFILDGRHMAHPSSEGTQEATPAIYRQAMQVRCDRAWPNGIISPAQKVQEPSHALLGPRARPHARLEGTGGGARRRSLTETPRTLQQALVRTRDVRLPPSPYRADTAGRRADRGRHTCPSVLVTAVQVRIWQWSALGYVHHDLQATARWVFDESSSA